MKRMGSEAPTRTAAVARPQRSIAETDRPTFSLALTVPIAWESLSAPPDDNLLDRLERRNAAVLGTLLKGVDLGTPPIEDEALAEALEPLKIKLDMIVEMVTRLAYRDSELPVARRIELGLGHILWTQDAPLPADTWQLHQIYFSDLFREPVVLAGRVKSCVTAPEDAGWNIEIDLVAMADDVSESFARLVFLEHRRRLGQHGFAHAAERRR